MENSMEGFRKLGLSDSAIKVLEKKGYTEPTHIQIKAIPLLLSGKKDIIGQSQTGTGKTAVFALPIIEKIDENSKTVQAIVLTPTRELAIQVSKEISSLKGDKNIKVLAVYGGAPIREQRQQLSGGIDIVVGTPGRVMDLQRRKSLRLDNIKYAVLDEADEMLNMGFVEDIESILENTPKEKSVLLFSATMPKAILKIAEKYMREYEFIAVEKTDIITKTVEQIYYNVESKDRFEALRRIIDYHIDFHGIIFCNTKVVVDSLTSQLAKHKYAVAALHGDIVQNQREKILQAFRERQVNILVATDVAARGIDVSDLTHVINYALPLSPDLYVHRIGRTGRAGKKGISITLVIPSEKGKLAFVEKINKCKISKRTLPSPKEIIENKTFKIKDLVKEIIAGNKNKPLKYPDMIDELLKDNTHKEVISALLKYSFKNELGYSNYKDIVEPTGRGSSSFSDRSGRRKDRGRSRQRSGRDRFRRTDKKSDSGSRGENFSGSADKPSFDFRRDKFKRTDGKPDFNKKPNKNKKFSKPKFEKKARKHRY